MLARQDSLETIAKQTSTSAIRHPARTMDSALMELIPSGVNAHRDSMGQNVKTTSMNVQQIRVRMVRHAKTDSVPSIVNVSKTMMDLYVNQV